MGVRATLGTVYAVLCMGGSGVACQTAGPAPLFSSREPLEVTLASDFSALKGDRRGETPERPAVVRLASGVEIEAKLRTRGRFRRERANCSFPPLRLNLKRKQADETVFAGQDKLKIVGSCRPNRDSYEQLVLNEYLAYEAFRAVSQIAFQVRLARVTYEDTSGAAEPFTRFAFFIEDDDAMAARVGAQVLDLPEGTNLPPAVMDAPSAAVLSVFQYMIGNTDWSDAAGHNTELLDLAGIAIPVPYDFDFSGVVDAPYSTPDPALNLRSVKERLYRGWCWSGLDMGAVLDRFRSAQDEILTLWRTFPFLEDGERSRAVDYLAGFFDDISTDQRAERRFLRDCRVLPDRSAHR